MKMIDQYTPVSMVVEHTIPVDAGAVVILIATVDGLPTPVSDAGLPAALRQAMRALSLAGALPNLANEIACQAVESSGQRLLVVCLGDRQKLTLQCYRDAAATVAKAARKQKIAQLAMLIDPALPQGSHEIAAACATGLSAGFFLLEQFKGTSTDSKAKSPASLSVTLVVEKPAQPFAATAVRRAEAIAKSQNFARAIAGHPGNVVNPPALEKIAKSAAKACGLKVRVLDEKQMAKLGMGGMLGVGMGSPQTPPRMIVLEWQGSGSRVQGSERDRNKDLTPKPRALNPLLLVGKAVTFDTGGISIKPREGMQRMVFDKCGAMAVLGAMIALARTKCSQRVIGILAAAENHVSATAYRPGDILTMYNGVTVEITNTDAEGRLVLADALAWGIETYKPLAVVDLATLTGGVVIALGKEFAGVFSNHDGIATEIAEAGAYHGEKMWRLPIGEEVKEMMKSDHADIVNSAGRHAHAIQGAEFLRRFVPEDGSTPWVHLDIAGVADNEKASAMYTPGATGWGVRTLVEWITGRSRGDEPGAS